MPIVLVTHSGTSVLVFDDLFPQNPILDTFNRADENPLGNGNWSGPIISGDSQLQILSNEAAPVSGTFNESYWSAATFGPDCEAYVKIVAIPAGTEIFVHARVNGAGASNTGYLVHAIPSLSQVRIREVTGATYTTLGANISQTISAGDSLGIKIVGTTITAYYKVGAGPWTALGSRTDGSHTGAGNIGLELDSNTGARADDFGGGTI